ncbi:GNAT family N-acetyltransferase [Ramlibacter sp. XY19]|uniref:GNAT family N-acetyltransferase n=1 Tax=Ramlibacter paludis TaxID=2908000 RepID=UPI0023DCC54F|nr:GNAT family protein [Ramlibacter paludis]MCG2592746.1 GNAT family N-acetyltransferase [Ramlibacter paludis]
MPQLLPESILTPRLRLRRPVAADAAALFAAYTQDSRVCRYMIWTPHASVRVTEDFIASFRVHAACDVENRPSQRALEKAGFMREGRLERFTVHPNISPEPRACYMYARCR